MSEKTIKVNFLKNLNISIGGGESKTYRGTMDIPESIYNAYKSTGMLQVVVDKKKPEVKKDNKPTPIKKKPEVKKDNKPTPTDKKVDKANK